MSAHPSARIAATILALVTWVALALQLYLLLAANNAKGIPITLTLTNFFSFFTILSNLLVAFVLTRITLRAEQPSLQAAAAVYISVVGIGYSLLLRHIWDPQGLQKLADILLHDAVPLLYVLCWFVYWRRRKALAWKSVSVWLIWPAIYLAYSMIRGSATGWYPYHFLDPTQAGLAQVISVIAIFLLAFTALGFAAVALTRRNSPDTC